MGNLGLALDDFDAARTWFERAVHDMHRQMEQMRGQMEEMRQVLKMLIERERRDER